MVTSIKFGFEMGRDVVREKSPQVWSQARVKCWAKIEMDLEALRLRKEPKEPRRGH